MASSHQLLSLILLISTLLIFLFTSPSLSSSEDFSWVSVSSVDPNRVTLSVYYETLCPYCSNFIVHNLLKIFENGLISIVNLRMIPWGNAVLRPDKTFQCEVPFPNLHLGFFFLCFLHLFFASFVWLLRKQRNIKTSTLCFKDCF